MRLAFLILVLGALLSGSVAYGAPKSQKVSFLSKDGTDANGYFFQPNGTGPFPAVIALHGCAGLFQGKTGERLLSSREDWVRRFLKAGYAVFFPDSNGTRGYRSLCKMKAKAYPVKLRDQVADLIGAANWIASQPSIDHSNVALVGWGTGGTAVLRILAPKFSEPERADFKAGIAFYPRCDWLFRATDYEPRLLPTILMGAADDLTPPAPCKALAERWGSPIELYKGAYHSFDAPNRRVRRYRYGNKRAHAGTNKAARIKAIKHVMQLFADSLDANAKAN